MIKPYSQDINDIILEAEYLAKGRALPVGTVREWSGKKYIKEATGWVPYTEGGKGGVEEKNPGKDKSIDGLKDIADVVKDGAPGKVQDHEVAALKEYQAGMYNSELGGYTAINQFMRTGKPMFGKFTPEEEARAREIADSISNAINKHPIEEPMTVYRGLKLTKDHPNLEAYQNMKVGDTVSDKAFMSASTSKSVAKKFSEKLNRSDMPVSIEISLKPGDKALPMNKYHKSKENEMLLDRNQKFKVVSVKDGPNGKIIKLESID